MEKSGRVWKACSIHEMYHISLNPNETIGFHASSIMNVICGSEHHCLYKRVSWIEVPMQFFMIGT